MAINREIFYKIEYKATMEVTPATVSAIIDVFKYGDNNYGGGGKIPAIKYARAMMCYPNNGKTISLADAKELVEAIVKDNDLVPHVSSGFNT